jgi:hypothetical protein
VPGGSVGYAPTIEIAEVEFVVDVVEVELELAVEHESVEVLVELVVEELASAGMGEAPT